ncbi:MAG: 2-keto-3-deoxygluconate permease [Planctomycetes bacterium]|nr:2-keto-3-deoxygluconate permease [Planctomycetota bacterium]
MKILATMKRFPAGVMVIPLLLGTVINTVFPEVLTIGGFTTGLFKNAIPTLVGLFLLCSGATINVKIAGKPIYLGCVLTVLKFVTGFGLGLLLNSLFGPAGILGLTPLAVIGAISNSNGVIYVNLAAQYGDEADVGAISILSLNDGPFLTMIALGASGLANIPFTDILASILPLIIGFIIGNLDEEFRDLLATGMVLLPPFNGFAFGAGMNLNNIVNAGIPGILLGLLTVLSTGVLTFILYSLIRGKRDPMGAAIGTTAGNAVATPNAVAAADPRFAPYVADATAQTAAAVVITAVLCPLLTSFCAKMSGKKPELEPAPSPAIAKEAEEVRDAGVD